MKMCAQNKEIQIFCDPSTHFLIIYISALFIYIHICTHTHVHVKATPKVMPPIVLCRPTMSDTVVGEMMGEEGRETITL